MDQPRYLGMYIVFMLALIDLVAYIDQFVNNLFFIFFREWDDELAAMAQTWLQTCAQLETDSCAILDVQSKYV